MKYQIRTFKQTTKDGRGYSDVPESQATDFCVMGDAGGITVDLIKSFKTRKEAEQYILELT